MADGRHYTIELAGQPLGPNEKRRYHWAVQARDTKAFRDAVALLARQQHHGPPLERARVDVTLVRRRGQSPLDPDNMFARVKAPVDGLVAGGMLVDDSADHIELHVNQEQGRTRATKIAVSEVCDVGAQPPEEDDADTD